MELEGLLSTGLTPSSLRGARWGRVKPYSSPPPQPPNPQDPTPLPPFYGIFNESADSVLESLYPSVCVFVPSDAVFVKMTFMATLQVRTK